jgi:site-specific DNA recombinase
MITAARPWIVYARVSTDEQAAEGVSLDSQQQACKALLAAHGHGPVEVFVDAGASAKSLDRPGMQALLARWKRGELAGVCAYALDRVTRSLRDLLDLVELSEQHQVHLLCVREKIDTSGPMGRFVLHIIAATAQLEREMVSSRTKAAMAYRKSQGAHCGPAPAGCVKVRDAEGVPRLAMHPVYGSIIADAFRACVEGDSLAVIAQRLNDAGVPTGRGSPWQKATMHGLLDRRSVIGVLIDQETWEAARQARAGRKAKRPRSPNEAPRPNPRATDTWPLRGLCWCGSCGAAMIVATVHSGERRHHYLRCTGRPKGTCRQRDLPYGQTEAAAVELLRRRLADGELTSALAAWTVDRRKLAAAEAERLPDVRKKRDATAQRRDRLLTMVEGGGDAARAATGRLAAVQRELEALDGTLTGLAAAVEMADRDAAAIATMERQVLTGVERLGDATAEEREAILTGFVRRIDVRPDAMELTLVAPGTTAVQGRLCPGRRKWGRDHDLGHNHGPRVAGRLTWVHRGKYGLAVTVN